MTTPETRAELPVPAGTVSTVWIAPRGAAATLVVAHGAGAGIDHPFLAGFCRAMGEARVATLRFNFPYLERGRRSPDPEGVLASDVARRVRSGDGPVEGTGRGRRREVARRADRLDVRGRRDAGGRARVPRVPAASARQAGAAAGGAPGADPGADVVPAGDEGPVRAHRAARRVCSTGSATGPRSCRSRAATTRSACAVGRRTTGRSAPRSPARPRRSSAVSPSVADATQEPACSRGVVPLAPQTGLDGAGLGAHRRLRGSHGARGQAVPMPRLRSRDPSGDPAPRGGAARRARRAPALARRVLEGGAQPDARSSPEPLNRVARRSTMPIDGDGPRRCRRRIDRGRRTTMRLLGAVEASGLRRVRSSDGAGARAPSLPGVRLHPSVLRLVAPAR